MCNNLFVRVRRHILDCLKAGFWPFLTLVIVFGFVRFLFNLLVPTIEGHFVESIFIALISMVIIIYLIGAASLHTRIVVWLKKICRSHPILLSFIGIFRRKIRAGASDYVNLEILYLFGNIYCRGYVGNDPIRTVKGKIRLPIHFSSPPTVKTGGVLFEVWIDDPNLFFTGRKLADHAMYVLTWGGGVEIEDEDEIKRFTQKIRLEIQQYPPQE